MIMEKLLRESRISYHKILIVLGFILLFIKTILDIKESNSVYSYISKLEKNSFKKNSDIRTNTILVKKDNRYFILDSADYYKIDSAFKEPLTISNNLIKLE